MYTIGSTYTRADIYDALDVPDESRGGDWLNGYHRHGSDYYIFCNVGVAGRTGHDYDNHWNGEVLVWRGKTGSHFGQQAIKNLISDDYRVLVFYRQKDRAPFTYAGTAKAIPHLKEERPARIDWAFGSDALAGTPVYTDEYPPGTTFAEGARSRVYVNRYERDRSARDAAIRHHGVACVVCGFDFEATYGPLGRGFIHVHHIKPVSEIGSGYQVDPIKDLVPLCPNCHAMVHRVNPPMAIDDLKQIV